MKPAESLSDHVAVSQIQDRYSKHAACMVFFSPLTWPACSTFTYIFDGRFPREHQHPILIRTISTQRDEAFLLANANHFDAHRHRVANVDLGEKFHRLSQIDAPRSGQLHTDHRRDHSTG